MNKVASSMFYTRQRLQLFIFLALHTAASFYYIAQHNITFDEPDYFEYAKRWLHGTPERIKPLDDSKTPIIAITWLPRIIRQTVDPNYQLNDYGRKDQHEGRYMMIFFSLLTAFYVYRWCLHLYGRQGWQLPLLLLLFDPLYLSYSTLISSDLASGAFLLAVLFHFNTYLNSGLKKHFFITAVLTGLAIVTKQSLLLLVLILPLLYVVHRAWQNRLASTISFLSIKQLLLFLAIVLFVINASYYFYHSFKPVGLYVFESSVFQKLQSVPVLNSLPIPLPEPYVQSLDMLAAHSKTGGGTINSTYNGVYLFGTLKLSGGYWYYYLVVMFFKMPVATLLLLVSSALVFVRQFNCTAFVQRYMVLVFPIMLYWIVLSFFNQFQTGIRHLLVIFPLLFIGLGYVLKQASTGAKWSKIVLACLLMYNLISVANYYPYIFAYTNEFVADKKSVYKKIFDSSVDYGQSDSSTYTFLSQHPEYKLQVENPAAGKYAVRMGDMINFYQQNRSPYRWYMAHQPIGHYRYTILLFDISEADLKKADTIATKFRIID